MAEWLIGAVARQTGVSAPTIRYYEEIGLLRASARSTSGYRRYSDAAIEELRFIKKAQALGFSLDEVGEILALSRAGQAPCSRVIALTAHHVAALDERIQALQRLRDHLDAELARWRTENTATCGRLCRWIANAADADARPGRPKGRPLRRRATGANV